MSHQTGSGGETPRQAGAALARLLADALQRRAAAGTGEAPAANLDAARLRGLLATLSADAGAMESFFPALGRALKARGLRMPALGIESAARPTPGSSAGDAAPTWSGVSVPAELMPLLTTLELALAPPTAGDAEVDQEALAAQLDARLRDLVGESPGEASDRLRDARIRDRAARRVKVAMRRHGLVPAGDAPAQADSFWDLVDVARRSHAGFVARLHALPRERLATFYWEHVVAVGELRRAGFQGKARDGADAAAQVVAGGHEAHAAAVVDVAGVVVDPAAAPIDLGAEAARVYAERFGEPLAPGL